MKVRFHCDSGANIHSRNSSEWMDVTEDFDMTPEEWKALDEEEKEKMVMEWAWNEGLETWYEEKD